MDVPETIMIKPGLIRFLSGVATPRTADWFSALFSDFLLSVPGATCRLVHWTSFNFTPASLSHSPAKFASLPSDSPFSDVYLRPVVPAENAGT